MRALIGVRDRTGLAGFAAGLVGCGVELVATDGTRRALEAAGIPALAVSSLTGMPEMLDGRVKTLHPAIHAAILARRDVPDHLRELADQGFEPIDIVVVSLYPFEAAVERGASEADIIENIDIGGPTLIRGAAKNNDAVAVVVSPRQYEDVLAELRAGGISPATRRRLAAEAFAHVAAYDTAVARHLAGDPAADADLPPDLTVGGARIADLRYGENPHQRGAVYRVAGPPGGLALGRRLQGPPMSFTNWLDADAAWAMVRDVPEPAAVIVKHTNPCGFAVAENLREAYVRAHDCDPRSAYGGVVGLNRAVDGPTAAALAETFLEVVVAPGADDGALPRLTARPRLRLLAVERSSGPAWDIRSIDGGLLAQTRDRSGPPRRGMAVATARPPGDGEWRHLLLAWDLCRHVKSNAIVIVRDAMAVGVGAGQMSRVEAAELAVTRAGDRCAGAVAASDAFFPMADGLEALGRAGVAAVIQPGGSRRDPEVVAAADALGMALVTTGERHFRH